MDYKTLLLQNYLEKRHFRVVSLILVLNGYLWFLLHVDSQQEDKLSRVLEFVFRDARVEMRSKCFLNCVSETCRSLDLEITIIFIKKKGKHKKPCCVTIYKNSAQTTILNSLVFVSVSFVSLFLKNQHILSLYQTSLAFSLI